MGYKAEGGFKNLPKMGDKAEGGFKNLNKWVAPFMDGLLEIACQLTSCEFHRFCYMRIYSLCNQGSVQSIYEYSKIYLPFLKCTAKLKEY